MGGFDAWQVVDQPNNSRGFFKGPRLKNRLPRGVFDGDLLCTFLCYIPIGWM